MLKNTKETLEKFIQIMTDPNHLWHKGWVENQQEQRQEIDSYKELFLANAKSYKAGQKILIIETVYAETPTRANLFTNKKTYRIVEVTIDKPLKTILRKGLWVGDGWEDVKQEKITYEDQQFRYTVDPTNLYSIPL